MYLTGGYLILCYYTRGEEPDTEYPLSLVTRDILQHSGTMTTRSKALDLVVSEPLLEINAEDARKFDILDNSHVKVSSRRGAVYLKAKVSDVIPSGLFSLQFIFLMAVLMRSQISQKMAQRLQPL